MPRAETSNLPMTLSASVSTRETGATLLQAHAGVRRGLKEGGEPSRARKAYLEAQWSGEHDRRPEPGLLTRARL